MKHALGFIALLFLLLTGSKVQAQVYPVSGNSVLIPPYSLCQVIMNKIPIQSWLTIVFVINRKYRLRRPNWKIYPL